METAVRARRLGLLTLALLLVTAAPALADPALPSNYDSRLVDVVGEVDTGAIQVRVEGGDSFFVLEVVPGTEVMVPGYDNDEDFSDIAELEQYLRVLPDGTVQLNRNSQAYYTNEERFGTTAPAGVGPDATPAWETVATDGRVAWHDHRIHWMSPTPPASVDTEGGGRVIEYRVPLLVDGELVVAEGVLDYVPERSPVVVGLLALLGVVAGALVTRRDQRLGAVLLLAAGGTITGLVLASTVGRPVGFDIATPPVALAAVGAVAPLLGATVGGLREGQRRALQLLGAGALLAFGVLATGIVDGLLGGPGEGFGNWWTNPTLPTDVAPTVLRYAIAVGTGLAAGCIAGVLADPDADRAALEAELRTTPTTPVGDDPAGDEHGEPDPA